MPTGLPTISVCVLAGRGAERLDACLAGLRAQIDPPPFELLVGGAHDEATRATVNRHFPEAQICWTGARLPGAARNPLIERARGELLLFLDDDVTVPADLLRGLARTAERFPSASVFGGPNVTPPGSSRFEIVQGAVLSSLIGAGPVSRRYGARHPGAADERWFTLCNLAVRRRAMRQFPSDLVCAEENAVLAHLRRCGEPMRYEPRLRAYHARRPTPRSFAQQMLKYGRGRGQLLRRRPGTLRAAFLAPVALLAYLLALVPLLLAGAPAFLALGPIALYVAITSASAVWIALTVRRAAAAPIALLLIATVHVAYGIGVVWGVAGRGRGQRNEEHAAPQWFTPAVEAAAPETP